MSVTEKLKGIWLFSGLSDEQLESLATFTYEKEFAPGDQIVEEGRTGNGLYLVLSGVVEAVRGLGTEQELVLGTLEEGEVFGEMALLGEWPRTASVRALDGVRCLGIDRWVFLSLLERQPQVAVRLLHILAQRLRRCDVRLVE